MERGKEAGSNYLGPSRMLTGNQSPFLWGLGSRLLVKGRKRGDEGQRDRQGRVQGG